MIDECQGFFDMFGSPLFGQIDKYVCFGMNDAMIVCLDVCFCVCEYRCKCEKAFNEFKI